MARVLIIDNKTGNLVSTITCKHNNIDKVLEHVNANLDHTNFYTEVEESNSNKLISKSLAKRLGILFVVTFIGSYIFFDAQETVRRRMVENDDYSKPEIHEVLKEIFN